MSRGSFGMFARHSLVNGCLWIFPDVHPWKSVCGSVVGSHGEDLGDMDEMVVQRLATDVGLATSVSIDEEAKFLRLNSLRMRRVRRPAQNPCSYVENTASCINSVEATESSKSVTDGTRLDEERLSGRVASVRSNTGTPATTVTFAQPTRWPSETGSTPTRLQECSSLTVAVVHVDQHDVAVHSSSETTFPNHVETVRDVGRHPFDNIFHAAAPSLAWVSMTASEVSTPGIPLGAFGKAEGLGF